MGDGNTRPCPYLFWPHCGFGPAYSLGSGSEELVLLIQVLLCQHHSPISSVVPIPAWVLELVCEQMDTSAL